MAHSIRGIEFKITSRDKALDECKGLVVVVGGRHDRVENRYSEGSAGCESLQFGSLGEHVLGAHDKVKMRREESIVKINEYLCDIELYSRLVIVIRVKVLYIAVIDNLKRNVS